MSLDLLRPNFLLDFLASVEEDSAWWVAATGEVAFEAFFDSPLLFTWRNYLCVFGFCVQNVWCF